MHLHVEPASLWTCWGPLQRMSRQLSHCSKYNLCQDEVLRTDRYERLKVVANQRRALIDGVFNDQRKQPAAKSRQTSVPSGLSEAFATLPCSENPRPCLSKSREITELGETPRVPCQERAAATPCRFQGIPALAPRAGIPL